MSNQTDLNALDSMLLNASQGEVDEVVKSEDLTGEGIDWDSKFFEPEYGKTYIIKFLPNIDKVHNSGKNIIHRNYYNRLPDPERRGKTFSYVARPGFERPNLLIDLFFELNELKKNGDVVAETKINKYLKRKQQACCKIQILKAADTELVGKIMMYRFHTFGQNALIANLINEKLNPSKDDIENGITKENIFDVFDSAVLSLKCVKTTFDGQEGRDFTGSRWLPNKTSGAYVKMSDGTIHKFTKDDLNEDGSLKDEVKPFFQELANQISDPEISIFRWFEPKESGHPDLSKEDNEYLLKIENKVMLVRDKIRDCTLEELSKLGETSSSKEGSGEHSDENKNKELLKNSVPDDEVPDELSDIAEEGVSKANPTKKEEDSKVKKALEDENMEDF